MAKEFNLSTVAHMCESELYEKSSRVTILYKLSMWDLCYSLSS